MHKTIPLGEWKCKLQWGVGFRGNPNSSVPEIPTVINSSVPEFIENIDSEMPFSNRYLACFGIREFG